MRQTGKTVKIPHCSLLNIRKEVLRPADGNQRPLSDNDDVEEVTSMGMHQAALAGLWNIAPLLQLPCGFVR